MYNFTLRRFRVFLLHCCRLYRRRSVACCFHTVVSLFLITLQRYKLICKRASNFQNKCLFFNVCYNYNIYLGTFVNIYKHFITIIYNYICLWCNNHTFLSLLVYVPYIIGCNIADTLRRAAINHISNYNYLCHVPPCSVSLLLCRVLFLFCAVCHAAFIRTPPPQTKTFRIQIVFVYRLRTCSSDREGNGKLCGEFKFSYIGNTGRENSYS